MRCVLPSPPHTHNLYHSNLLRTSCPIFCSTHCFFMELKRDFFLGDALVMRSVTVWTYFLRLQSITDFTRDSAFRLAAGDLSSLICIISSSWLSVHCSQTSIEAADGADLEAFNVLVRRATSFFSLYRDLHFSLHLLFFWAFC